MCITLYTAKLGFFYLAYAMPNDPVTTIMLHRNILSGIYTALNIYIVNILYCFIVSNAAAQKSYYVLLWAAI